MAVGLPAALRSVVKGRFWAPLSVVIILVETVFILRMKGRIHQPAFDPCGELECDDTSASACRQEICQCGLHFDVDHDEALVFPAPKVLSKKFLTIGIPTIKRRNGSYVAETVRSLLANMKEEQRKDVLLVLMAADTNSNRRQSVLDQISSNFPEHIGAGDIHVIAAPRDLYTSLKVTKLTYVETPQHVRWRSKQNFDYAFQMRYSAPLSHYYMQLEDDVIAAEDYVSKIQQYLAEKAKESWICLEFSELGFIGKLYRTKHLARLSQLMLLFYQEQPGDFLYDNFNDRMHQTHKHIHVPTLFQHQGLKSSLDGKKQKLVDRLFNVTLGKCRGDNPPAQIHSTMVTHADLSPEKAYGPYGVFWSKGAPRPRDNYVVVFDSPQPLERILVVTGLPNGKDQLQNATVGVSSLWNEGQVARCLKSTVVGSFKKGKLDVANLTRTVDFDVKCLEITVTRSQRSWVFIQEVNVFVSKKGRK